MYSAVQHAVKPAVARVVEHTKGLAVAEAVVRVWLKRFQSSATVCLDR